MPNWSEIPHISKFGNLPRRSQKQVSVGVGKGRREVFSWFDLLDNLICTVYDCLIVLVG